MIFVCKSKCVLYLTKREFVRIIPLGFCILIFGVDNLFGQNVTVSIQPRDSFRFELVSIYPDSFPLVSTIFKAENKYGEPLWLLDKNDFIVTENEHECEIISLRRITDQKSIKVGLVVDHSGSMMEDYYQFYDSLTNAPLLIETYYGNEFPKNYVPPIESAKKAVKEFIYKLDQRKDSVQIIGFSNFIDSIIPFTSDTSRLAEQIDSMRAIGGTALYNAIGLSLKKLKEKNEIRVLIALTDGLDNSSKVTPSQIIDSALKYEIPIYTVALGNAETDILKLISDTTGGPLFYSKSSSSLADIYQKIAKKILALYELKHLSFNMSSADNSRDFRIEFKIDSLQLMSGDVSTKLPQEVIQRLKEREEAILNKEAQFKRYVTYGSVGLGVLLLIGGYTLYNKKRSKLLITNAFPNPADRIVNINYSILNSINCRIIIVDVRLRKKVEEPISSYDSSIEIDISGLSRGVLLLRIVDGNGITSNTYRLLKR